MKNPAFYAFVFGLTLSSCQTVKRPQELAIPQSAVTQKRTPDIHNRKPTSPAPPEAHNKAKFFGEIWIRPGRTWWHEDGETLYLQMDGTQDGDPRALSYSKLKSMYRGVVPKKSSDDRRIYKLVWGPPRQDHIKLKAQPTSLPALPPVLSLEQAGPLP